MYASIELIQKIVNDCAARGCSSYSFAEIYKPDRIDHLSRYFMKKGYKISYTPTKNPNRILIKISW